MGWRILQLTVAGAVMCANVYWAWTPNGYLASILAGLAAVGATMFLAFLIDLWRYGGAAQITAFHRWRKAAFCLSWKE